MNNLNLIAIALMVLALGLAVPAKAYAKTLHGMTREIGIMIA